jgi:hypothetical protein
MANFMFNIAKGRSAEFQNRVDSNDPANSAFVLVPLSASDSEANAQDADTLTAALATAMNEQTASGWARVTFTDADVAAMAVDDTNNRMPLSLPQKSLGFPTAGAITGVLICYDPDTTAGTDDNIIPISHHDASLTGNGNEVVFQAGDVTRAT